VIDPLELIRDYGAEAVRYYLARHISPFEDGDITIESFKEAYNAHLANGLGNLVSRIMKMANDNLEVGPEIAKDTVPQDFLGLLENFEINKACDYVWEKIAELDKFIQDNQPFKVVKEDKEKGQKMISDLVKSLYTIARMLSPILPETSTKIKSLIKENKIPEKPLFVRKD
jgi:methionyl-tRNA synthetase